MNIKDWAVEDRPREKLCQHGAKTLTNAELLAILLSTGTKEKSALGLAKDLLMAAGNELDVLARMNLDELCLVYGIGEAKAVTVKAALELANRRKNVRREKVGLHSSEDVYHEVCQLFRDLEVEEFWVLYMNKANRLLERQKISVGTISHVLVDAKRIFKPAINKMAYGVILCHNHPSGRVIPSAADIKITEKVARAGRDLDVQLIDHLIFGDGDYYSFKDAGRI